MIRPARLTRAAAGLAMLGAALAACSGTGAASGTHASTAHGLSVVYVAPNQNGAYIATSCGAQQVAEANGMKYSVQYAQGFSASNQIPLINAAVAAKPDVLLVSPADTKALIVPLKQAAAQGIHVVTVGNGIADDSFLTSAVTGGNVTNGKDSADLLAELANGRTAPHSGPPNWSPTATN